MIAIVEKTQCPVCRGWAAYHGDQHGYTEIVNCFGEKRLIETAAGARGVIAYKTVQEG